LLLLLGPPALAEPSAGERAFQKCFSCHSVEQHESGLPGPNLFGIVGRRAAAAPDFEYSPAMRAKGAAGLVWTAPEIDLYIADPNAYLPGTSMSFVGMADAAERAALLRYLEAIR
jgi:cytochrome c